MDNEISVDCKEIRPKIYKSPKKTALALIHKARLNSELKVITDKEKELQPIDLTNDLMNEICQRIAEGETVVSICNFSNMPSVITFYGWQKKHPDFETAISHARKIQSHMFIDFCTEIAIIGAEDTVKKDKLMIDTLMAIASKINPKDYGKSVEHKTSGKIDVVHSLNDQAQTLMDSVQNDAIDV